MFTGPHRRFVTGRVEGEADAQYITRKSSHCMQQFEFHGHLAESCGLDLSRSRSRRPPLLPAFSRRIDGIFHVGMNSYGNFITSYFDAFLMQAAGYQLDFLLRAQEDPHAPGSREFI